jgi:hypothetical protein
VRLRKGTIGTKHINNIGVYILNNYGVYLEFVVPKTVFFETRALSAKDAELDTLRKFKDTPGLKLLHVFEVTNTPTYAPKDTPKIIDPSTT